jgi:subtilisin family serine protease
MRISRFAALLLILTAVGFLTGGLIANAKSKAKLSRNSSREAKRTALKKLSPWVVEKTARGDEAEFLVVMEDQADLSLADSFDTKEAKGRYVFDTLMGRARVSQYRLIDWLKERGVEHRAFYIVNAILVKGGRELALELAGRADVARIEGNPQLRGVMPIEAGDDALAGQHLSQQTVEPGVGFIRAPEVWSMGFTGQGIIIGGQDTGAAWDHPALRSQYRGWDGSRGNHDYNWHDSIHSQGGVCGPDSRTPCDDDNHGTHTLGTAVGAEGNTNQIGVAPGSKFIACRNMDRGNGTPATYLECFEFFLAPYPVGGTPAQGDPTKAPDITTNSWTCPPSEGCSQDTLKAAVEAQRAAGIMTVVAAGNSGRLGCSTVSEPPAFYDASYSIGAVNSATGEIAGFSSRGPVNMDGSNRVKPDITAPGVAVRSALRNGGYSFLSGTSMAAPHVAGAVALLWSARPELRGKIDLTENIINESAVRVDSAECGANTIPNNVFGYGRLDIKAAVDLAATTLSSTEQRFGIRGGAGKVEVNALEKVKWRAISNDLWITIAAPAGGEGSGVVNFTVAENRTQEPRRGSLMIAGRTVTIIQPGSAPLFAVSGRVVSNSGDGLGRVTLSFSRVLGGGDVPGPVQTDESGNWSQRGFEPGTTYRVSASRSRIAFSPSFREFEAPVNALNFASVGRRVILGISQL